MMYVPVYSHTCNVFEKTEISFFNNNSCCDSGCASETIDFKCCSLSSKAFYIDYETTIEKSNHFILEQIGFDSTTLLSLSNRSFSIPHHKSNHPPLILKSNARAKLQVFRI